MGSMDLDALSYIYILIFDSSDELGESRFHVELLGLPGGDFLLRSDHLFIHASCPCPLAAMQSVLDSKAEWYSPARREAQLHVLAVCVRT